ncbi:MAG: PTS sugar transporter subunit IIB [Candidatus Limnocylindria bacterium]
MPLALVRVDDRLIHGQVVAVWLRELDARRIVVVDDAVAHDQLLREVIELAAPKDVEVEVLDVVSAAPRLSMLDAQPERSLVLVRSPLTALRLTHAGVQLPVVNVGGVGAAPGRRRVHRTISLSDDEIDALRELERSGTRVELQIVPSDRPLALRGLGRRDG